MTVEVELVRHRAPAVQRTTTPPDAAPLVIAPGGEVTFGDCRTGCCQNTAVTAGAAGRIGHKGSHWVAANHSEHVPLRVWNLGQPTEHFILRPRQPETPVPFRDAGISGAHGHVITVRGPSLTASSPTRSCAGDLPVAWGLNPETAYFAVMLALVGDALAGDSSADPPSAAQIANRLGITVRQVHEHTDYLARRLGVRPENGRRTPGWKRRALVRHAVTHAYVPTCAALDDVT